MSTLKQIKGDIKEITCMNSPETKEGTEFMMKEGIEYIMKGDTEWMINSEIKEDTEEI